MNELASPHKAGLLGAADKTKLDSLGELPASGTRDFVASGTLPDGSTVILNSDGTVSVVTGTDEALGSPVVFETGATSYISVVALSATQVLVAFVDTDNSSYGKARVGTVAGTTITFGAVATFEVGNTSFVNSARMTDTQAVIVYGDSGNNGYGKAVVCTVAGTSVSFGTQKTFESGDADDIDIAAITSSKFVIVFKDKGDASRGKAIVGSITGTTISVGGAATYETSSSAYPHVTRMSDTQVVIAYLGTSGSYATIAVVGTIASLVISFGTPTVIIYEITNDLDVVSISSTQVVVAYRHFEEDKALAIVGTVVGTDITFGAGTIFNDASTDDISINAISSDQIMISYIDESRAEYGTISIGTVVGTDITFDDKSVFHSARTYRSDMAVLSSTLAVMAYTDLSSIGTAVAYSIPVSDNNDFIGITAEAITDTETGTVTILGGVSSNQSSLTIGTDYYVDNDGTLTTTANSAPAGKAVSATELLVTGGGA